MLRRRIWWLCLSTLILRQRVRACLWVVPAIPLTPPSPWRGLPHKKDGDAGWKIWKKILRGTKILFFGAWLEFFFIFKRYQFYNKALSAEKDMNLWLIIAVIHTTYAVLKLEPEKNSCLNGLNVFFLGSTFTTTLSCVYNCGDQS